MAIVKTNAARTLDRLGIAYEPRKYAVDPDDLAAESVALKLGMPAEQVFKTLVFRGTRHGVGLAVIPGDALLDLKALARQTGDRKVETVPLKEVQPPTGYIRGIHRPGLQEGPSRHDRRDRRPVRRDLGLGRAPRSADPHRPGRLHPRGRCHRREHRQG